jgi:hypothetical protein
MYTDPWTRNSMTDIHLASLIPRDMRRNVLSSLRIPHSTKIPHPHSTLDRSRPSPRIMGLPTRRQIPDRRSRRRPPHRARQHPLTSPIKTTSAPNPPPTRQQRRRYHRRPLPKPQLPRSRSHRRPGLPLLCASATGRPSHSQHRPPPPQPRNPKRRI